MLVSAESVFASLYVGQSDDTVWQTRTRQRQTEAVISISAVPNTPEANVRGYSALDVADISHNSLLIAAHDDIGCQILDLLRDSTICSAACFNFPQLSLQKEKYKTQNDSDKQLNSRFSGGRNPCDLNETNTMLGLTRKLLHRFAVDFGTLNVVAIQQDEPNFRIRSTVRPGRCFANLLCTRSRSVSLRTRAAIRRSCSFGFSVCDERGRAIDLLRGAPSSSSRCISTSRITALAGDNGVAFCCCSC
jgi:hypothetical protein